MKINQIKKKKTYAKNRSRRFRSNGGGNAGAEINGSRARSANQTRQCGEFEAWILGLDACSNMKPKIENGVLVRERESRVEEETAGERNREIEKERESFFRSFSEMWLFGLNSNTSLTLFFFFFFSCVFLFLHFDKFTK